MTGLDVQSLGEFIRQQRHAAEVSLRELARQTGISNPYLSQVERGLKKPSAEILAQIANGLRISAETLYVRAGLLDERHGDRAVVDAVNADPHLTQRQRQVLLEIYAAFQAENASRPEGAQTADPVSETPKEDAVAGRSGDVADTGKTGDTGKSSKTGDAAQTGDVAETGDDTETNETNETGETGTTDLAERTTTE